MKQRRNIYGYGFLGISLIGLLFFYVIPLLFGGWQIFLEYGSISFAKGIRIYREVFESFTFRLALKNTICLMLCCIPTLLVIAIGLTWYMDSKRSGKKSWTLALWLIPYIIPSVIVVQIIRLVFGREGLLAFTNISFLDSGWTFFLLCLVFLWRNCGYVMVILLSGCSNIADEQREAARLDGAGSKGVFRYIILPQLRPFIKFSVVMGIIGCF